MRLWLLLLLAAPLTAQRLEELCAACHTEQAADFKTHPHSLKMLSCDACHGSSEKHRQATGSAPPDRVAAPHEIPALCGSCHPAERKSYSQGRHAKLIAERSKIRSAQCGTCHGVHALRTPAALEAQCRRCHEKLSPEFHPPSTTTNSSKVSCASCHDTHSLVAKKK